MTIDDSKPRRAMAGVLYLLILFSVVQEGVFYTGELMDGLPVEYQKRLQVLKHTLAHENRWSPVWSEKLKSDAPGLQQPDVEFCTKLIPDGSEEQPVDTFTVVQKIVDTCWFSGMYVNYGLNLLSRSIRCFHHRHARLQLAAIDHMLPNATDETVVRYLHNIISDYQLAMDKLAVVDSSLKHTIQLVTFYNDVANNLPKIVDDINSNGLRGKVKKVAKKIRKIVESDFNKYCAIPVTEKWYDEKTEKFVDMSEVRVEDVKPVLAPKDEDAIPLVSEDHTFESVSTDVPSRIEYLRQIMRRTFDGLLIEQMPQEIWRDIFFNQILMKSIDLQKVILSDKPKNTTTLNTVKTFPWKR